MLGLELQLTSVHLGCTGTLNSRVMSISIHYFIDRWRILLAVTWKIAHARGPARRSDTGIVDWHRTEFLRIRTSLPASCTGWLCNDLSGSYWLSVTAALDGRSNTWVIRITELPVSLTDMSSSVYTCCSAVCSADVLNPRMKQHQLQRTSDYRPVEHSAAQPAYYGRAQLTLGQILWPISQLTYNPWPLSLDPWPLTLDYCYSLVCV